MKAIFSMTIVALFSTLLAGCWFYSRPDPDAGCQKTTYGIAIASTSTEDCGVPSGERRSAIAADRTADSAARDAVICASMR